MVPLDGFKLNMDIGQLAENNNIVRWQRAARQWAGSRHPLNYLFSKDSRQDLKHVSELRRNGILFGAGSMSPDTLPGYIITQLPVEAEQACGRRTYMLVESAPQLSSGLWVRRHAIYRKRFASTQS